MLFTSTLVITKSDYPEQTLSRSPCKTLRVFLPARPLIPKLSLSSTVAPRLAIVWPQSLHIRSLCQTPLIPQRHLSKRHFITTPAFVSPLISRVVSLPSTILPTWTFSQPDRSVTGTTLSLMVRVLVHALSPSPPINLTRPQRMTYGREWTTPVDQDDTTLDPTSSQCLVRSGISQLRQPSCVPARSSLLRPMQEVVEAAVSPVSSVKDTKHHLDTVYFVILAAQRSTLVSP